VVVAPGFANGLATLVALNPVAGIQEYDMVELAEMVVGLAWMLVDEPWQKNAPAPENVTWGVSNTVTVKAAGAAAAPEALAATQFTT